MSNGSQRSHDESVDIAQTGPVHFCSNIELAGCKASLCQSTKCFLGLDKTILDIGCVVAGGRGLSTDVFVHLHNVTFNTIRRDKVPSFWLMVRLTARV